MTNQRPASPGEAYDVAMSYGFPERFTGEPTPVAAQTCGAEGCGKPLSEHYAGIGCIPGHPGGRVINRNPYQPTEADRRGHGDHLSALSATPSIASGGWDARIMRCDLCKDEWTEVRAMPAEGVLIDPDPHLPSGARP